MPTMAVQVQVLADVVADAIADADAVQEFADANAEGPPWPSRSTVTDADDRCQWPIPTANADGYGRGLTATADADGYDRC